MGTRGVTGFRVNGVDKIGYQQFDSYPEGVGQEVVEFIQQRNSANDWNIWEDRADALRVVTEKTPITPDIVAHLKSYTDLHVSNQSTDDWYCLTRETQGKPDLILRCGYVTDNKDFLKNSLFCEWGYIINFVTKSLEVYRGFQTTPHSKGRFAKMSRKPRNWKPQYEGENYYYPVALVTEIPFSQITDTFSLVHYLDSLGVIDE